MSATAGICTPAGSSSHSFEAGRFDGVELDAENPRDSGRRQNRSAPHREPRPQHARYPAEQPGERTMPEIRENNGIVTQITTVKLPPDNEKEVLDLMAERARFMATQPGFVSVSLHRSQDGSHVVNYVQWTNREKLAAAHHSPEFRKKWPRFGELAKEIEPYLYDVVHVEAA
jgi:heme-degrading monooxygenase HmoA